MRNGQNRAKTDKTSTRFGTSVISRSREVFLKPRSYLKLKMSTKVLKESEIVKIGPLNKFTEWSLEFQKIHYWSLCLCVISIQVENV